MDGSTGHTFFKDADPALNAIGEDLGAAWGAPQWESPMHLSLLPHFPQNLGLPSNMFEKSTLVINTLRVQFESWI